MATCLCCTDQLVHHLQGNRQYWFCRSCHQEMPATMTESKFSTAIMQAPRVVRQSLTRQPQVLALRAS
jgi:NAD-dependent SIR2 family protein deacetylase